MRKEDTLPKATKEVCENLKQLNKQVEELRNNENCTTTENAQFDFAVRNINTILNSYNLFDEVFEENDKHGVRNLAGEIIVPAIYDDIPETYRYDGKQRVIPQPVIDNKLYGLAAADGSGNLIAPCVYNRLWISETFHTFYVITAGHMGLISATGVTIIPPIMDKIYEESNGIRQFCRDGKWGLLAYGWLYVAPLFDEMIDDDPDECISVRLGNVWGWLDKDGRFTTNEDEASICDDLF